MFVPSLGMHGEREAKDFGAKNLGAKISEQKFLPYTHLPEAQRSVE